MFNLNDKTKQRGQGIKKVSDLFLKYKNTLRAPQGSVIAAFIVVVDDLFSVALTRSQCSYSLSSRTLSVKVSGMIKSEITLKKKEILMRMVDILGEKSAPKEIL